MALISFPIHKLKFDVKISLLAPRTYEAKILNYPEDCTAQGIPTSGIGSEVETLKALTIGWISQIVAVELLDNGKRADQVVINFI
jgi:hypothetical protein